MASVGKPGLAILTQRVREFPDEQLTASAGKLFCQACREEVSKKLTVIKTHVKTKKHTHPDSKKRRHGKAARERDIAQSLVMHDQSHSRGETLSTDQRVYKVKVVTAFLRAGLSLSKLECFRDILEEHAYRLTDRWRMSDLISFILTGEQTKIKGEI